MAEKIKILDSRKLPVKIALYAVIIAGLVFAWFGVRWQFGSMLGELTPPGQPGGTEIAALAVALAPSDPRPLWLAANEERNKFTPESSDRSVQMFEEVVRHSPFQYRWWLELGRAYEQADSAEKAEAAYKRAVELAPFYTLPKWQMGNFYLRQNRTEDAFVELKAATERSHAYREQVFSLAWDYFDKDPSKVERIAADTPDVRASLALFYAVRNSPRDSLRMWNTLTDEQKAANPQISSVVVQGLHDKGFFRESQEYARQIGVSPDAKPEAITNGDFESIVNYSNTAMYNWRISRADSKLDVAPDSTVKHGGGRSLKFNFRSFVKPVLQTTAQVVVVEPNAKYRLSVWVRTENLRSGGMPFLEVVNANDAKPIAASNALPTGTNDWQQLMIDFTAPENAQGIVIRTSREPCGGECPIAGIFWYDDFAISRM